MPCYWQLLVYSFPYNRYLPENGGYPYSAPMSALAEGKSFPLIHPVNVTSLRSARTENRHMEVDPYLGRDPDTGTGETRNLDAENDSSLD